MTIKDELGRRMTRRDMLANLAALAVSLTGVSAMAQVTRPAFAKWDDRFELAIDVEIGEQDGFRARRPYVATWLEDKDGNAVRTLGLWVRQPRGKRWLGDLRRWMRDERERESRGGADLVDTVSAATRVAGLYTLTWNGRDDAGKVVDQGQYFVCVEAAREHGTYQLIRTPFTFGTRPFRADLGGNPEVRKVAIDYRVRK
jgi:thiamine biosynthesis lipoprotein